ncbi:MAG: polysaccharide biosynthesis/export family protein [Acidobacteriota bacterium]|nr:polysaccharide biosynthesis/export family protein [Acidobacteriota bacterium]
MNLLGCTLLSICLFSGLHASLAQQGITKPVLSAKPTAPEPPASALVQSAVGPLTTSPDYVIGADDSLKIDVWREAQLSGVVPVRPDGKITLPLLHDVQAAGLTPMQLEADITSRLAAKFVTDPVVSVTVEQSNSKRVFMVGEVGRPGPMAITPGMTILQAIASAGLTPYANAKKIYILRGDPVKQQKVFFDYKKAVKKGDMQGVTLIPGDTIVVPQ